MQNAEWGLIPSVTKKPSPCGTCRRAGATVIFAYGEWYCYAVIFGLRRVVFATQVWEANIIPLRPSGAISLLLATISRWHSQHITSIWYGICVYKCSACQEKRTENVKHSLSFSCQFEYTALWQPPLAAHFYTIIILMKATPKHPLQYPLRRCSCFCPKHL